MFAMFKEQQRLERSKIMKLAMKRAKAKGVKFGRNKVPKETEDQVKIYIQQGLSSHKIQTILHCGGQVVNRVAQEMGIPKGISYAQYFKIQRKSKFPRLSKPAREKIAAQAKNLPRTPGNPWVITNPQGQTFNVPALKPFCKQHNLQPRHFRKCGKTKGWSGYRAK